MYIFFLHLYHIVVASSGLVNVCVRYAPHNKIALRYLHYTKIVQTHVKRVVINLKSCLSLWIFSYITKTKYLKFLNEA
jgi:hypothetical protein